MNPMISADDAEPRPYARRLPLGWCMKDQAEAARSAAMAFAWYARSWDKRQLARWLIGPYTRAVAAARTPIRRRRLDGGQALAERDVLELVRGAHAEVTALLRTSSSWRAGSGLTRRFEDRGFVVAVLDEEWTLGHAPASRPGMRLADRVLALFIADFLSRPAEYERFRICGGCDGATFDHHHEHAETCGDGVGERAA